jgi:hypothetical protein
LQGCVRQGVCYIIHELEDSSWLKNVNP